MKKQIRNIMFGLLSTSMGVYMMAAPFATTAHASENKTPAVHNKGDMSSQNKLPMQYDQGGVANKHQDPIKVVKAEASRLGLDAKADEFSLVNESASLAVVQVIHDDTKYNVTLKRSQPEQGHDHKQGNDPRQGNEPRQGNDLRQAHDQKQDRHQEQNNGQRVGQWIIVSVDKL